MDIVQVKDVLSRKIIQNNADSEAYQLALDVLNNTYSPEFTQLEAKKEEVKTLQAELEIKNSIIAEKDSLLKTVEVPFEMQ